MDFFSKFTKTEQSKPVSDDTQAPDNSQPALNSDLFNSAKVVTGAAQSYFTHQPADQSYGNAEVAGASADLLKAASDYGKLDETQGVGKYVGQAETYLDEYKTSHTTAAATTDATTTDTRVDCGDNSVPTSKIPTTEEYSDKVPTYASGEDLKVGTTDASDEYDQSEGGYKAGDGLSSKTAGDGGGFAEDDEKLSGGVYVENTEDVFSKKPTSGIDTTVGTDASDKYDKFEGGYKTADDLSSKTAGDGGGFTEDDEKLYGGEYVENTEEVFSKKPTSCIDTTVGTDASDKYEQEEDTAEDNYSKKPSGGVPEAKTGIDTTDEYDQSGDGYENKNESEDFSYKSSGGAKVAESGEGCDEDTAEDISDKSPAAQPCSYSTAGDDVSDKYTEESEGGGYGNFTKAAVSDFLKK